MTKETEDSFSQILTQNQIGFKRDQPLRLFSWFRTGGSAKFIIYPKDRQELQKVYQTIRELNIPFKVIGETTNLLFLDDEEYSCLLSTALIVRTSIDLDQEIIRAECGAGLPCLSRFALLHGAVGFAGLEGIPGTVGGAVFMNAGAYGDDIKKVLKEVIVLSEAGEFETLRAVDLNFGYRQSIFRDGSHQGVIVEAVFHYREGDKAALKNKMELFHAKRHKYNEYCYPNLGSLFAGSIYRELAKKDRWYYMVSSGYYVLNYRLKFFRRESPINRKWLNDYTVKRFGFNFDQQPFSDKTMNSLINNGQHSSAYLAYIETLTEVIGKDLEIENEIVKPF